ncbi:MAG: flagellar basal body P-ring formation protein FlgA [Rubellimicrobium sp.]|nr:flagellar basal body P-ring formation protein FlgA [Rubellimicrobium sp.]
MIRAGMILLAVTGAAQADIVVPARNIPARSLIAPDDLILRAGDIPGALADPGAVAGMEARVALYANRPIRAGDIGPPAIVERNQTVTLVFDRGGLVITTEGRALDRAGPGDVVRVMNLASRTTVSARIDPDGSARVGG